MRYFLVSYNNYKKNNSFKIYDVVDNLELAKKIIFNIAKKENNYDILNTNCKFNKDIKQYYMNAENVIEEYELVQLSTDGNILTTFSTIYAIVYNKQLNIEDYLEDIQKKYIL
jgi:hypothetical protein